MEFELHMRLVQKTTLELRRSSNPASSALSHATWLMPPTSLWLSPQPMPFAFLGTRSPCQIPVAAVPLNGKSTALLTESADPQGQMAVGRSTERRDDLLRQSYAWLQQRLVRSVSCSTAQLFCAQGLLSQPALGLPHSGCAITNLSQPHL